MTGDRKARREGVGVGVQGAGDSTMMVIETTGDDPTGAGTVDFVTATMNIVVTIAETTEDGPCAAEVLVQNAAKTRIPDEIAIPDQTKTRP